jgi:hypothetical protein
MVELQQKNLVLANTQEYRAPYANESVSPEKLNEAGLVRNRYLGLAVIPGRLIEKIEAVAPRENALSNINNSAWGLR